MLLLAGHAGAVESIENPAKLACLTMAAGCCAGEMDTEPSSAAKNACF